MRRIVLPAFLLAAAGAQAAIDLGSLAKNSPFGGSSAPATTLPSLDTAGLELRGMYVDQGKTYLSLYNATTKQSTWVAQGEAPSKASADLGVRAFDPASGVAVVESGNHTVQIPMKKASVAKYEAPKEAPVMGAGEMGGPGGGLPQPGPDGKVQTPWGSFTPEQIAAFRAEREKRWAERMAQAQQEGGAPGADSGQTRDGENGSQGGGPGGGRGGRSRGGNGGGRGG